MHPGREKQPAVGPLMFKTSSPPSILFFLPPSILQRKRAQAIKSTQIVKHLLGQFTAAKSILSPPEQQYEDIFWAGATGTYQEIRGDNGWMEFLGAANAQSGGLQRDGERRGGIGGRDVRRRRV